MTSEVYPRALSGVSWPRRLFVKWVKIFAIMMIMKSFWLNDSSGRQARWATDGHRWVAAEPRGNGLDLWG